MLVDQDDKLQYQGRGEHGVLGNGDTNNVVNLEKSEFFQNEYIQFQKCGNNHNIVYTKDKRFYTFGRNDWGQLALNSSLGLDMQEAISCPQQIQNLRVRNENDVIKDEVVDSLDIKHMATSENQSVFIDVDNKI